MPELHQTIDIMQDITNRNIVSSSLITNANGAPPPTAMPQQNCLLHKQQQQQQQQTNESKLRRQLKKLELLLDNASIQLRQDNHRHDQSLKQQTIFTTASSAITTTMTPSASAKLSNDNNNQLSLSRNKTNSREASLEDIDTLKSVLSCPIFNRLIDIQDSLDRLSQQMLLHPSISLTDFDIDENSGELILAPPIENVNFTSRNIDSNIAPTIINNNNNNNSNQASMMLHQHYDDHDQHHHHHQPTMYNFQKQNNFNHQTEIIFDESNIKNNYHLNFNSSEFDAHQHVLQSLRNNLQTNLTNETQLQAKRAGHDLDELIYNKYAYDSYTNRHNDPVLYSTVNHLNGKCKDSVEIKSMDANELMKKTQPPNQSIKHEPNLEDNQRCLVDTVDNVNNSALYSAVKINNNRQENTENPNSKILDLNHSNESPIFENILKENITDGRRSSNPPETVSDRARGVKSPSTKNSSSNQVHLTTLDSYSTTTIVTPVAEKLLDSDISLTSRTSCSPSVSIGSTVKLIDEGYSGASSLQSNIEKQNINGTPLPQARITNTTNNSTVKVSHESTILTNYPSQPSSPTKLSTINLDQKSSDSSKNARSLKSTNSSTCPGRSGEKLTVTLKKNELGLGITVAGLIFGKNLLPGIYIKNIVEGSPAAMNKNIQIDDQICAIDGIDLTGFSNKQAVELLKATKETLTLELKRSKNVTQSINYANTSKLSDLMYNRTLKGDNFRGKDSLDDIKNRPRPSQNGKPIPAPKPSTISYNNNQMVTTPDRPIDNTQNNRQQISSTKKGPAPQPPLQRAAKVASQADRIDDSYSLRRQSLDNNIIESVSGSRNTINISSNTNSSVKTRAEITINVKDSTPMHKSDTFPTPRLNPNQIIADSSSSFVDITHKDMKLSNNEIACDLKSKGNSSNIINSSTCVTNDNTYSNFIPKTDTMPMWDEKGEAQIIKLNKGNQKGLGFSVLDYHNPTDPKQTVIVIRSLVPGGIADLDGKLVPGDRLLFVDDKDLKDATLEEAVKALKEATGLVSLGVLKPIPYYNTKKGEKNHPNT